MIRQYLLDASALLAIILNEAGSDRVQEVFDNIQIHAINPAEVAKKLFQKGMPIKRCTRSFLRWNSKSSRTSTPATPQLSASCLLSTGAPVLRLATSSA